MVFEPRNSPVESRSTQREREQIFAAEHLFEAGNRVRFDDSSGIVAACFPDGICHVRVDGTNRMVATHASMLTLDRTQPNRTIKTPGVGSPEPDEKIAALKKADCPWSSGAVQC